MQNVDTERDGKDGVRVYWESKRDFSELGVRIKNVFFLIAHFM